MKRRTRNSHQACIWLSCVGFIKPSGAGSSRAPATPSGHSQCSHCAQHTPIMALCIAQPRPAIWPSTACPLKDQGVQTADDSRSVMLQSSSFPSSTGRVSWPAPLKSLVFPKSPHYLRGAAKSCLRELSWCQASPLAFLLWIHITEQGNHNATVPIFEFLKAWAMLPWDLIPGNLYNQCLLEQSAT